MAKLSLAELRTAVASYVGSNKVAYSSFSETRNNIVGLLDKIGAIVQLDTSFFDKLPELEGTQLSYGRTIEEWYQDLIEAVKNSTFQEAPKEEDEKPKTLEECLKEEIAKRKD